MGMINECTLVAGRLGDKKFLFKNRDVSFIVDTKIIHEVSGGVEMVYYTDKADWTEGMNEFGVGLVYSFYDTYDISNPYYTTKYWIDPGFDVEEKNRSEKGEDFREYLRSKTAEEMIEKIKKSPWDGSFLIGDTNTLWEVECFRGEIKVNQLKFSKNGYKVKTNHGEMIPYAGHKKTSQNFKRASSEIRKVDAGRSIQGFTNFTDLIRRMSIQNYDKKSTLNFFRTDDTEITVSQVLLQLDDLIMTYLPTKRNSNFFGLEDRLPKGHTPKISVMIRKHQDIVTKEYEKFLVKKSQLTSHLTDD